MVAARERGRPLCTCCRCPPGHGDIYPSLLGSGMLDRLSKAGVKYLFVSNSDNLGATLDVSLLSYFAQSDKAFIMEVRLFAESDTAFIMEVRLFAESDEAFIMEVRCQTSPCSWRCATLQL